MRAIPAGWCCYLLECADGTLYAGITIALPRRLALHNAGRASRYTRARRPVTLVYAESQPDRSAATRREFVLKRLSREGKRALVGSAASAGAPAPARRPEDPTSAADDAAATRRRSGRRRPRGGPTAPTR